MSGNRSPGHARNPAHRVDTRPAGVRVRIVFNGEVVADTRDAVRLDESGYPPVYYVPRNDVRMEKVSRTDHGSYCPYKGQASYFSLQVGDRTAENAAWSYEQPYDEVADIRERLAFYRRKVDRIEVEEA
jgi:uncharacterized protein (DUF427 family)